MELREFPRPHLRRGATHSCSNDSRAVRHLRIPWHRSASIGFAVKSAILPNTLQRSPRLPLPVNDPFIKAIAGRIRAITKRPGHTLDALASILRVSPDSLRRLIRENESAIDINFLIDVVAALVREFGVDPKWLLTGEYDSSTHRHALLLGEDRTSAGARMLQDFVREHFDRLRHRLMFASLPAPRPEE